MTSEIAKKISNELDVMSDDIHVTDGSITFYLPTGQLGEAKNVLGRDVEIIEEFEHEYLVKIDHQQ